MKERKNVKGRRTHKVLAKGPRFGNVLLNKLRPNDVMGFRNFTQMTPTDFEDLLLMVGYGQ